MLRNLNNTGCINWKLGSGYTRASHVMPTDLKIRGHNGPSAPYGRFDEILAKKPNVYAKNPVKKLPGVPCMHFPGMSPCASDLDASLLKARPEMLRIALFSRKPAFLPFNVVIGSYRN